MARPHKWRRVCSAPRCTRFAPENRRGGLSGAGKEKIEMTVDEYEAIRLIDFEGLNQAECAERMEVARTTVQSIYASARKKLARFIVLSVPLQISGGEYKICGEKMGFCRECHRFGRIKDRVKEESESQK